MLSFDCKEKQITVETQRLLIRSYQDRDFENCVLLYGDPKLTKYFDYGRPRSRREVLDLVEEKGKGPLTRNEPFGLFSMFDKASDSFIGQMDFMPAEGPGIVEIGCILFRQYHNQGFPSEALSFFIKEYVKKINDLGFSSNGAPIQKVTATAHPKNYSSQRLIKSLGMIFERQEDRFNSSRFRYYIDCRPETED